MSSKSNESSSIPSLEELIRAGKLVKEPVKIKILGESLSKSRRDRMFGRGVPFIRHGRQIRFDPRDIRDYIDSNRRDPQIQGAA